MKKVLFVGESWVSAATHYKGFDQFGSVTFHTGGDRFVEGMAGSGYDIHYMKAHDAAAEFPTDIDALSAYDVLILSDVGANTLLLHPNVWLKGERTPNRLKLIAEWTRAGGGLMMIGGYFSFQGIDGRARWRRTPVEDVLPVNCLAHDDRLEIPEGCTPVVKQPEHPILKGVPSDWPYLLGVNEIIAKPDSDVDLILSLPDEQHGLPLLVTGSAGKGRSLAWASDMSEHWLPKPFLDWPGYDILFRNMVAWAAGDA